jgi:hypothetical protein
MNFNSGTGLLVEQCCIGTTGTFDGDFARGDIVVVSGGPLTINFNTPVQSVGAQIQDNGIGDHFTAQISAFDGSTFLGSFTENGFSGDVGDNSDIFLGVLSSTADITSIVFQTFSVGSYNGTVGINQMTIEAPPSAPTPLPSALPLFATGLAGLGLLGWRRRRKAHVADIN